MKRILWGLIWIVVVVAGPSLAGCARMPITTKVLHEDARVVVKLQDEVDAGRGNYSRPVDLNTEQAAAILRNFSIREKQPLPLRWFTEELPPQKLFREDELAVLTPYLVEALKKVGDLERVYFEILAPGKNPRYSRDVTGGWIKVREHYFLLTLDYFHVQQPVRNADAYYSLYPTPWVPEKDYLLYFEPGRFYVTDPKTRTRAVDFEEFLKTIPSQ